MSANNVSIHAAETPHPDSLTDEQLEAIARRPTSPQFLNHFGVHHALLNLKGAIHLARVAVEGEMNTATGVNEELVAAEGTLTLAEAECERIYLMIYDRPDAPLTSTAEVDHV